MGVTCFQVVVEFDGSFFNCNLEGIFLYFWRGYLYIFGGDIGLVLLGRRYLGYVLVGVEGFYKLLHGISQLGDCPSQ